MVWVLISFNYVAHEELCKTLKFQVRNNRIYRPPRAELQSVSNFDLYPRWRSKNNIKASFCYNCEFKWNSTLFLLTDIIPHPWLAKRWALEEEKMRYKCPKLNFLLTHITTSGIYWILGALFGSLRQYSRTSRNKCTPFWNVSPSPPQTQHVLTCFLNVLHT